MPKEVTYHESAIHYNEVLEAAARKLIDEVEDPVVKKWCRGIANQHKFHLARHTNALSKIDASEDGNSPAPKPSPPKRRQERTQAEEQAEFAAKMADEERPMDATRTEEDPRSDLDAQPVYAGVGTSETDAVVKQEGVA